MGPDDKLVRRGGKQNRSILYFYASLICKANGDGKQIHLLLEDNFLIWFSNDARNRCTFGDLMINDQINVQGQRLSCTFYFYSSLHLIICAIYSCFCQLSYFCLHSDSWIALLCQGSQPTNVSIRLHFSQSVPWPPHLKSPVSEPEAISPGPD